MLMTVAAVLTLRSKMGRQSGLLFDLRERAGRVESFALPSWPSNTVDDGIVFQMKARKKTNLVYSGEEEKGIRCNENDLCERLGQT